jgi:hypothetical protein
VDFITDSEGDKDLLHKQLLPKIKARLARYYLDTSTINYDVTLNLSMSRLPVIFLLFLTYLEPHVAAMQTLCSFREKLQPLKFDRVVIDSSAFERYRADLKEAIKRIVAALRMHFASSLS